MKIKETYSINNAEHLLKSSDHISNFRLIKKIIKDVKINRQYKISLSKNTIGKKFYDPKALNRQFNSLFNKEEFFKLKTEKFDSNTEIDFYKDNLGLEIQFGKYAFITYDINKLKHFNDKNIVKVGVLVVPTKKMAHNMSVGGGNFDIAVNEIKVIEDSFKVPIIVLGIEP